MMRTILTISGAFLWVGIVAGPVAAQSLGLAPAEIRSTFKPQQVLQFDLNVSNDGDTPIPMRASVMDLWFDQKTNEKVFGAPGTSPHSAANWVAFVPPTFTVPAHGTGKVKVVITPPAEAAGGSYAVLFVESNPIPVKWSVARLGLIGQGIRLPLTWLSDRLGAAWPDFPAARFKIQCCLNSVNRNPMSAGRAGVAWVAINEPHQARGGSRLRTARHSAGEVVHRELAAL